MCKIVSTSVNHDPSLAISVSVSGGMYVWRGKDIWYGLSWNSYSSYNIIHAADIHRPGIYMTDVHSSRIPMFSRIIVA